jgi:predicted MFS family arabinose efflux permease
LSALAAFRVRNFRFQWPADLATAWAFEMETIILGWYVLIETGSVVLLTVFGSLQFLGTLVAPMLGIASDRIGARNLLCLMRAAYAVLAAVMMAMAFSGAITPLYVLLIAGIMGLVRPSDIPIRSALVAETIPAVELVGAMSISRTTSDSARVAGALAGAGLLAALGMGPAYIAICSFYLLGMLLTLGVTPGAGRRAEGANPTLVSSPWSEFVDTLRYVWAMPHILAVMCLAFLINVTAFPMLGGLMPYIAKDVFGVDQRGLGYLVASLATGAVLGSLLLSTTGSYIRPARMMIVFCLAWHCLILLFSQTTNFTAGMILLLITGFMQSLCVVPMAVVLLRSTESRFRGRVMGIRTLVVYGWPLALMSAGALITRLGYATTAIIYCVSGLVLTLMVAVYWRGHLWRLDAAGNSR